MSHTGSRFEPQGLKVGATRAQGWSHRGPHSKAVRLSGLVRQDAVDTKHRLVEVVSSGKVLLSRCPVVANFRSHDDVGVRLVVDATGQTVERGVLATGGQRIGLPPLES